MIEIAQKWATNYCDGEILELWDGRKCEWLDSSENMDMFAGYKYSEKNWVLCLKFVLPTAAQSLTFNFVNSHDTTSGLNPTMRYKITTAEDSSLVNATSDTTGDGTFKITSGVYNVSTITMTKTLSAGTYYIYIWTDKSTSYPNNWMCIRWFSNEHETVVGTTISYEELASCIYIDNGSGFDAYEIWIDNGTKWEQYAAYIDNGSGWDECG